MAAKIVETNECSTYSSRHKELMMLMTLMMLISVSCLFPPASSAPKFRRRDRRGPRREAGHIQRPGNEARTSRSNAGGTSGSPRRFAPCKHEIKNKVRAKLAQ